MLGLLVLSACDRGGQVVSQREKEPAPPVVAQRVETPTPTAIAERPELLEPPPEAPSEPNPEAEPDEAEYVEPEPPALPEAPEHYGKISPPDALPTEAELVNHGLVGYEVVAVYAKPDKKSARLGYLRIGTRLKVTDKVKGVGCKGGWHGVPQGGYACAGKGGGLVVDAKREPYLHRAPPPPALDKALPYEYALVRKWNTPMYWRVPTAEEQVVAAQRRAVREAKREGKPLPGEVKPAPDKTAPSDPAAKPTKSAAPVDEPAKADATKSPKALSDLPKPPDSAAAGTDAKKPAKVNKPVVASKPAAGEKPATQTQKPVVAAVVPPAEAEPEPEPIKLPLNPATSWLEKGFYVSLAGKLEEGGKHWWRTARGGYIPAKSAVKYGAKDHQGHELDVEADFPFGYAMAKSPQLVELTEDGKLKIARKIERRTFLDLSDETEVNGRAYMVTVEGLLIRKDHVRFAERQAVPDGIQPWERWIDVDISKQLLVAYEGERAVFTTLISSGRKGTKEEPFDTPTGRWRIRSKHVSTTMDGPTASDGNYSIQDVPWTMYFFDSYALHGAFWHDGFGRVRSHGCVNLGPSDARWLFNWTTPFLPEGWHGVHAHDGSPGTTVVVRKSG